MPRIYFSKPWIPVSLCIVALVAATLLAVERRAERSYVSRGALLVETSGCYACHGRTEQDPRQNFRSSSSGKMRARGVPTFWENGIDDPAELTEWIRDGVPADERERHERLLIQMPAYGGTVLDEEAVESIVSWIIAKGISMTGAMGNGDRTMPEDIDVSKLSEDQLLVLGDRLSRQQGCYQCHGEFGQGGVLNPRSFKGYLPGFFGEDLLELTDGGKPEEVLHWIDTGRGRAIESGLLGGVAKRFLDSQSIGMPGYESLLSESEKRVLVDYVLLLNRWGPLDSAALIKLNQRIAQSVSEENTPDSE